MRELTAGNRPGRLPATLSAGCATVAHQEVIERYVLVTDLVMGGFGNRPG